MAGRYLKRDCWNDTVVGTFTHIADLNAASLLFLKEELRGGAWNENKEDRYDNWAVDFTASGE